MRRALTYLVVAAALCTQGIAAEHKTWNRIRYVGGTIPVKASPYDWNTTLTVTANPDMIILSIAPSSVFAHKQTVRIQPSQVSSLLNGSGAWERVAGVSGAQLPAKPPTLFGLLLDHSFFGILYQTDDGKNGAILLDSFMGGQILLVLRAMTGKTIEYLK